MDHHSHAWEWLKVTLAWLGTAAASLLELPKLIGIATLLYTVLNIVLTWKRIKHADHSPKVQPDTCPCDDASVAEAHLPGAGVRQTG